MARSKLFALTLVVAGCGGLLGRGRGHRSRCWTSWRTSRSAAFGAPTPIYGVGASPARDDAPFISADGRALYFRRADVTTMPSDLIMRASWTSTANPFGAPTFEDERVERHLRGLARSDGRTTYCWWPGTAARRGRRRPEFDIPSWLSDDGCRMYLSSRRLGTFDIFLSTRGP